jgi:3-hydroxyacyl-CoA dehydrogenase/enoyl-CoA hydratase/carnithine racemase
VTTTAQAVLPESLVDPAGGERVTRFPVRVVDLSLFAPGAASSAALALVTMDNGLDHTKPTTLGAAGLLEMRAALDAVEALVAAGRVAAVAITGKPFVFAAGADLTDVSRITTREQSLAMARLGHDQLRRLGELRGPGGAPVPSFALVNGVALGGGLEVALHCSYRTVSTAAGRIALPECALGLVPGWGGTHLLPRLVGVERALQVIVANPLSNNRMLTGPQAVELGIGDVLLEPADFVEESLRWAARVLTGDVVVDRPDHAAATSAGAWDAAVDAARRRVGARLHGAAPAYERALDLVVRARTDDGPEGRDAAFAAEDAVLAELLVSEEFRSGVYAFDLTTRRAKRPAGAPDPGLAKPVAKVGVVGAGLMASQLALLFVRRLQVPVVLTDLDAERVAAGVARVHGEIAALAARGRVSADAAQRLTALVTGSTSTAEAFAGADWVIEAVFEDLAVKRAVFAQLEAVVSPECVLATNTSSLSVTAMAEGLAHPERVVGFHFFNPVAVLPLVEVARTAATDDATLATAFAVGKQLGKSCVLVRDAPAFVVNRLLMRMMGEVHAAFDEGTPAEVADTALDPLGLPMTPFALLRLVGPAVALHVQETLHAAFPDRFAPSPNIARVVAAGLPGFWAEGSSTQLDPRVAELLVVGDAPSTAEQVRERALVALAQEARLILDEGVVADPRDVDLCLLLGVGWPAHLGGLLPHLDRSGVAERATGRRFLPPGVASVPPAH